MYNCFETLLSNPLRTKCTLDSRDATIFFLLNFGSKNNERQYLTTISKYSFMLVRSTAFRNIVCPELKSNN